MKVKVMNYLYQMSQKEHQGLLQVAKERMPLGIYVTEKQGYAGLHCDKYSGVTQLEDLTRQFKTQGLKVHANKGDQLMEGGADGAERVPISAT